MIVKSSLNAAETAPQRNVLSRDKHFGPKRLTGILEMGRSMIANVNSPVVGNDGQTATAPRGLLGPISALAREKKTWSPGLLPGVLWRGVTNLATFYRVLQLIKLHPFSEAARLHPRFAFKYLTHDYLARDFSVPKRAACFIHHYKRLQSTLPDRLLRQTLQGDVTLHESVRGCNRFGFSMGLSRVWDKEGELSLNLLLNDVVFSLLAFTIVPGWVVDSDAEEIVLITRVQGLKGCQPQIKLAQDAFASASPRVLLLAALQGIADAFGIVEIAGVSAINQSSYSEESAASLGRNYDSFFAEVGMTRRTTGFFASPVPIEAKPLGLIKRGNKPKVKLQRALKLQIQQACAAFFEDFAQAPTPELVDLELSDSEHPVSST
jgi:uncharacterized protein VirK/YbjX